MPDTVRDLTVIPLSMNEYPELAALSVATLVVDKGNRAAASVLRAAINTTELREIQQEVLEWRRPPAY